MSFLSHDSGSIAATVSNPNGGSKAFFETKFNACFRLQKVHGTSGFKSNIFIYPVASAKKMMRQFNFTIETTIWDAGML
jgi:hypothetical protein